ncbi:MAG: hypothetical protein Q4D71_07600 [Oscillospiraceae bacterium]|nr:hypothetical protein [Oscillospiraceae bacterium]
MGVDEKLVREEELGIIDYRWAVPNLEGVYMAVQQMGHGCVVLGTIETSHQGHAGLVGILGVLYFMCFFLIWFPEII